MALIRGAALAVLLATACGTSPRPAVVPSPTPVPSPSPSRSPSPSPTVAPRTSPSPAPPPYVVRVAGYPSMDAAAAALAAAERTVRDPKATAADAARAGREQQRAYRWLVVNPSWRAPVVARLPSELRAAAEANVGAGAALRAMTKPRATLPPWRIVAPPPAAELLGYYRDAAARTGVEWTYLAAIHLVETRMGRIRGTSTAGARGPMQFLPSTWATVGEGDIESARDSIRAAARYLVRRGGPGDMDRALYGYNPDRRYVAAVSAYARVLRAHPLAYRGYHAWQVTYRHADGDVLLLEGYRGR